MRCPQCTERNSVAARKCEFCGEKFKRKPLPLGFKLAVGGVAVAVTASIAASYVVPKLSDPGQNLARVAKRVAAGPTSVEDAHRGKTELSSAIRTYLKDHGSSKSSELTDGLQKLLPESTYEVHIAELPRGLRVVEVDTLLQATGYLLMKTSSGNKVFDLPGFEVFDDARILNDTAGPVLVLIGHSGGQPPHRPCVKSYALLPDSINDETDKIVPRFAGDGAAKFASNNQDINLQIYPQAKGKASHVQANYGQLHWKDARYVLDTSTKTAAAVRTHFNDVPLATTPAPVAVATPPSAPVKPAATKSSEAQAAATANLPTASSTALRVAAAASPAVAKVIEQAKASNSKGAKIVVRGLTDKPTTAVTGALQSKSAGGDVVATLPGSGSKSLLESLPGAEVGTRKEHRQMPVSVPTAAKPAPVQPAPVATKPAATKPVAAKPATSTASSSRGGQGTVIVNGATLRADHHRSAAALTGLGKGEKIDIIGSESNNWYHVRYKGQTGYIYAPLVDASGKTAIAAASETPAPTTSHRHRKRSSSAMLASSVTSSRSSSETTTTSTKHRRKRQSSSVVEAPTLVP